MLKKRNQSHQKKRKTKENKNRWVRLSKFSRYKRTSEIIQFTHPQLANEETEAQRGKTAVLKITQAVSSRARSKVSSILAVVFQLTIFDAMQTHGLQPARLLCPWDSPGKNTGVGGCSLLQGIFPNQGSNLGLLHYRYIL